MADKLCRDCKYFDSGRCLRYPPFLGPHGIPDAPLHGTSWSQDDHQKVDPDQPCCGEFKP